MTQQEFIERYSYDPSTDALGSGGFGSVYKAYDNEEDSFVALKISNVDPKYPELRLRNEVSKAHDLRHKNVARYEACHTFRTLSGEMDVAIMHYYEHGSLNSFISSGELSYEVRCDILTQLLEGIAYLHKNGIIHRDLKPQNVLMVHHAGKYIPKITDFGISKQLAEGDSSMVSNSLLGGTRSYASPEQLRERGIRKNTDIWSFGVIAYYMLAGELPFTTGDASSSSEEGYIEQMRRILAGALPESINRVPEPWQSVIRGCLVVDNNQRLQHAEDCLAMLNGTTPIVNTTPNESTVIEKYDFEQTVIGDNIPNRSVELQSATGKYRVGDYYNRNGIEGVVFEVSDNGMHGKVVSLDEVKDEQWCSDKQYAINVATHATNRTAGRINHENIISRSDFTEYMAFTFSRNKGEKWYIPAIEELTLIHKNKSIINIALERYGTKLSNDWYWSSTEESGSCAWFITMSHGRVNYGNKRSCNSVRAVATF